MISASHNASMNVSTPHYLLFSEVSNTDNSGRWRFLLRAADGSEQFEVADVEPEARGERLALLTVVRALENLDQPSQVTLIGCNPYIRRGVTHGLHEWKNNGWRWEFFGQMVPVRNGDLWQRMDHALRFHQMDCRSRPLEPTPEPLAACIELVVQAGGKKSRVGISVAMLGGLRYFKTLRLACRRGHDRWIGAAGRLIATGKKITRRYACELGLLWKTSANWLREDMRTRLSYLVRTR